MPLGEFSGYFFQQRTDLAFWQGHDPRNDPAPSLRISWAEWPKKHAGLVGLEYRGRAFNMDCHRLIVPGERDWIPLCRFDGDGLLKAGEHILRQAHFG